MTDKPTSAEQFHDSICSAKNPPWGSFSSWDGIFAFAEAYAASRTAELEARIAELESGKLHKALATDNMSVRAQLDEAMANNGELAVELVDAKAEVTRLREQLSRWHPAGCICVSCEALRAGEKNGK